MFSFAIPLCTGVDGHTAALMAEGEVPPAVRGLWVNPQGPSIALQPPRDHTPTSTGGILLYCKTNSWYFKHVEGQMTIFPPISRF